MVASLHLMLVSALQHIHTALLHLSPLPTIHSYQSRVVAVARLSKSVSSADITRVNSLSMKPTMPPSINCCFRSRRHSELSTEHVTFLGPSFTHKLIFLSGSVMMLTVEPSMIPCCHLLVFPVPLSLEQPH